MYSNISLIGEGSYTKVYSAYKDSNHIAVKIIKIDKEGISCPHLRELEILRWLKHPNLVPVYDIIIHPTKIYVEMEYIPSTFKEHINSIKFNVIRKFAFQLLNVVSYLHSKGVVHRDIKPDNILINMEQQRLFLIDFNLSKKIKTDRHSIEVVSLDYRAPELLNSEN